MAGLAAIEVAQKVAKYWRFLRNANKNGKKTRKKERLNIVSQNRGGACCTTSGLSETSSYGSNEDKYASGRSLSWQDVYSVAVKWRQISEPCDPVVWVNKLRWLPLSLFIYNKLDLMFSFCKRKFSIRF